MEAGRHTVYRNEAMSRARSAKENGPLSELNDTVIRSYVNHARGHNRLVVAYKQVAAL